MAIEDQVRRNTDDLRKVEEKVSKQAIQHGRLFESFNGFVGLSGERHSATTAGIDEIKDLIKEQRAETRAQREKREAIENDERDAKRQQDADDRRQRAKWRDWLRKLLDGRTIVLIIIILLSLFAPDVYSQISSMFTPAPAIDIAP